MKVRVIYWTRHERVWPTKKEAKAYYDERQGVMVESIEEAKGDDRRSKSGA